MWRPVFRLSRLYLRQPICRHVRLPLFSPPAAQHLPALPGERRGYSSESPGHTQVKVIGLPNPLIWARNRFYFFFIRTYLDRDFSIEEFTQGAKQAFSFVSGLLSQCKFDALENLVTSEMLKELKEKCSELSENYRKALAAESNEILYTFPGDVRIFYDDGRRFVSILVRFWYLKHTDIPEEELKGTKGFQMVVRNTDVKDQRDPPRILTADYEFRREFTQGAKPDWIITHLEHSKLLE